MTQALIDISADGMIRNFGGEAAAQARRLALRHAERRHADAARLWTAIAEAITRQTVISEDADTPGRSPQP